MVRGLLLPLHMKPTTKRFLRFFVTILLPTISNRWAFTLIISIILCCIYNIWQNISRCYYHTTGLNAYHTYYLIVVTKGNDTIQIRLNDYSYNGKELADAIDSYAGRKIFGQTKEDQIKEIKGLLIALVCVIAFVSFIILMLSLSQGE